MCQSHTGRLTGLWFLPKPAFGLNTDDDDDNYNVVLLRNEKHHSFLQLTHTKLHVAWRNGGHAWQEPAERLLKETSKQNKYFVNRWKETTVLSWIMKKRGIWKVLNVCICYSCVEYSGLVTRNLVDYSEGSLRNRMWESQVTTTCLRKC